MAEAEEEALVTHPNGLVHAQVWKRHSIGRAMMAEDLSGGGSRGNGSCDDDDDDDDDDDVVLVVVWQ